MKALDTILKTNSKLKSEKVISEITENHLHKYENPGHQLENKFKIETKENHLHKYESPPHQCENKVEIEIRENHMRNHRKSFSNLKTNSKY